MDPEVEVTTATAALPLDEVAVNEVRYEVLYNTGNYENIKMSAVATVLYGQDADAVGTALRKLVEGQVQAERNRRAKIKAEDEARYLAEQNARYERARAQREAAAGMIVSPDAEFDDVADGEDDAKPF